MSNAEMGEMEDKAFSSIDFVGQCLFDSEKAEKFEKVIHKTVKNGDTVLDVGTGSGILALLSAAAGAKKVVALEFDPFVAEIAKQNFKSNGYEGVIETVVGDAREHLFDSELKFDVVTMELLSSGMVDEMQVQAANDLHARGVVSEGTIFIPSRQETYVTLANVDFKLFGFTMKMILHDWKIFKNIKTDDLSDKTLLNSVDFSKENDELFEKTLTIPVIKSGIINAVWLSSRAVLDEETFLESTISINPPVAIPVPEREVSAGDTIQLHVRYKFGYGYQNFRVEIR